VRLCGAPCWEWTRYWTGWESLDRVWRLPQPVFDTAPEAIAGLASIRRGVAAFALASASPRIFNDLEPKRGAARSVGPARTRVEGRASRRHPPDSDVTPSQVGNCRRCLSAAMSQPNPATYALTGPKESYGRQKI